MSLDALYWEEYDIIHNHRNLTTDELEDMLDSLTYLDCVI